MEESTNLAQIILIPQIMLLWSAVACPRFYIWGGKGELNEGWQLGLPW